jgi:hypothetical protein
MTLFHNSYSLKNRFDRLIDGCNLEQLAEIDAWLDDIRAELFPETTAELQHAATGQGL